ncbi:hypothetical protein Efla_004458 [Eimeria flavescens]
MAASPAGEGEPQTVNLNVLTLSQFASLKRRMEVEVHNISSHLMQLRAASARLAESREALIQFDAYRQKQKEGEAPEILVPLTGALYVKGHLQCADRVLVDIGAGYLLQKTCQDAKKDGENTLALVSEQQGKLEKMLNEKQKQLEVIVATMRQKFVQQQIAAQDAAAAAAAQQQAAA